MNRREFNQVLGLSALALGAGSLPAIARKPAPQFSITMDDLNWGNAIKLTASERNQAILNTLQANSIKAALFVIGRNLEDDEGKQLLSAWNEAGHLIGNHTYSHRNFNAPTEMAETYEEDILRAEELLRECSGFRKYFRFPMLKVSDTVAKRDAMRSFLAQRG